ncbi:MAG: aminotransferase class V-fold PLP-dependent enzyme [Oligoflexales bacterium]|nr:aminotransferase class V-fold PLP-dependent enzyme [Oligoflexales bacterium]
MGISRRECLEKITASCSVLALGNLASAEESIFSKKEGEADWERVRGEFVCARKPANFAGFLLAPHPRIVRQSVDYLRRELDRSPPEFLHSHWLEGNELAREKAAEYMGVNKDHIALTDSTTMGLGLIYHGLKLDPSDEVLTSNHDHYSTHESLRLAANKRGFSLRKIDLYQDIHSVSEDEIVQAVLTGLSEKTKVLALTWVHSSTGLKLPIKKIAESLKAVNALRPKENKILFCVDGVHGFGSEEARVSDLDCDFFIAGCHKWMFGPRGTGLVYGKEEAWDHVEPIIPNFDGIKSGHASIGQRMTPGGFHSFEHRWSLAQAFEFHKMIGREKVAARIRGLNTQLKQGLLQNSKVSLYTPLDQSMSSGIVCFDIKGMKPSAVVNALFEKGIIGSQTPYKISYARLSCGLLNNFQEVDAVIKAIDDISV